MGVSRVTQSIDSTDVDKAALRIKLDSESIGRAVAGTAKVLAAGKERIEQVKGGELLGRLAAGGLALGLVGGAVQLFDTIGRTALEVMRGREASEIVEDYIGQFVPPLVQTALDLFSEEQRLRDLASAAARAEARRTFSQQLEDSPDFAQAVDADMARRFDRYAATELDRAQVR